MRNYLHNTLDLHTIRQMLLKSRHKILMPIMILELASKVNKTKRGQFKNAFSRNFYDRTDMPVFNVEEAVEQLKNKSMDKNTFERETDEFFLTHLPEEVVKQNMDAELNDRNLRHAGREIEESRKKTKTVKDMHVLENKNVNYNSVYPEEQTADYFRKKPAKSHLELESMKNSEAYKHLIQKDEEIKNLDKTRTIKTVDSDKAIKRHSNRKGSTVLRKQTTMQKKSM